MELAFISISCMVISVLKMRKSSQEIEQIKQQFREMQQLFMQWNR